MRFFEDEIGARMTMAAFAESGEREEGRRVGGGREDVRYSSRNGSHGEQNLMRRMQ